jgi:predicted XRE-type DNA-binding protein
MTMAKIPAHRSSGNVFRDIGFSTAEAAELTAKSSLIDAISDTIGQRKLTQKEAAKLCDTDQPTLSKVLRGRMESVTIDRLAAWLTALGRTVEIHVRPYNRRDKAGHLLAVL